MSRRGEARAEGEGEAEIVRSDHMRSTMATVIHAIAAIKDKLTDSHYEAMKKTPFYLLLESVSRGKLQTSNCRKMDANIIAIVQLFNTKTKEIRLGNQEVSMNIADVRYIFGIVDGNRRLDVAKGGRKPSVLADRLFPGTDKITQKLLRQKLEVVAAGTTDTDVEDTIRLLCLILISSLFFSSSGLNIVWGWLDIVEDLDKISSYDWCSKIIDTLVDSMTARKDKPNKINGCTIFLLYWLCEHTNIIAHRKTTESSFIPRILKWNLPDMWTIVNRSRLLELPKQKVIVGQLTPTMKEMQVFTKIENERRQKVKGGDGKKSAKAAKGKEKMIEKPGDTSIQTCLPARPEKQQQDSVEGDRDDSTLRNEVSNLQKKVDAANSEVISLLNEIELWKTRVTELESSLKQKSKIIADFERQRIQSRTSPPTRAQETGERSVASKDVNYDAINFNAIRRLGERVKELEKLNWEKDSELTETVAKVSNLTKDNSVKTQDLAVAYDTILDLQRTNESLRSTIEQQKKHAVQVEAKMMEMEDFVDNYAAHAVSQALKEKDTAQTPNSMYGKIKNRKRKALEDDDFEYEKKKDRKKIGEQSMAVKTTVTTKERTSFLKSLDRRCRGHCGRMVSNECLSRILQLKSEGLGETVYCSDDKKIVVDVNQILNILQGEFIDNFVIDAFSKELLKKSDGDCVIVTSNCWNYVKDGKNEGAKIFSQFVEANKQGTRLVLFPFNSSGASKNARPYHWTLLVWDTMTEDWSHYNSMKPRHVTVHDPWFDDAGYLKSLIESKTKPPPEFGFSTQDIAQSIRSIGNLPQQEEGKNDCALYVCYFMAQLVLKRQIQTNLNEKDMNKFKGKVIESIVMRHWLL